MSGQRSISQVQAHMKRCGSIFVFQCSFGAVVSVVLSGLEKLFSSIPEWFVAVCSGCLPALLSGFVAVVFMRS